MGVTSCLPDSFHVDCVEETNKTRRDMESINRPCCVWPTGAPIMCATPSPFRHRNRLRCLKSQKSVQSQSPKLLPVWRPESLRPRPHGYFKTTLRKVHFPKQCDWTIFFFCFYPEQADPTILPPRSLLGTATLSSRLNPAHCCHLFLL